MQMNDNKIMESPGASDARATAAHWLDRSQPNALNAFRLGLALVVIYTHGAVLAKYGYTGNRYSLGAVAVNGFFIISGFLITGSWLNNPNRYLRARVLRILPGFYVAFFFSLGMAALLSGARWLEYLKAVRPSGVVEGLIFLDPRVLERGAAFAQSPFPSVVNGPMWTIAIEFLCYLGVAIAGVTGVLQRRSWVVTFFAITLLFAFRNVQVDAAGWGEHSWPRFASCFCGGVILYLFKDKVLQHWALGLLSLVLVVLSYHTRWFVVVTPIFGTYLLFWMAYSAPAWIKAIGSRNDISYGTYLYAFPLQQAYWQLSQWGYLPQSLFWHLLVCSVATIALGWASWLLVEKPAHRR